jgi:hypothetical protein
MEMKAVETQDTNDVQIAKIVIDGMNHVMDQIPGTTDKEEALGFLMIFAYNGMRELQCDAYV